MPVSYGGWPLQRMGDGGYSALPMAVITGGCYSDGRYKGRALTRISVITNGRYSGSWPFVTTDSRCNGWPLQRIAVTTDGGGF
jgi:hypothetical protein